MAFAVTGLIALLVVTGIAATAYVILYRHFDRVMVRPESDPGKPPVKPVPSRLRRPAFVAIRTFTLLTLRRSALHQGVVVAIAALGAALVVNSLLGADFNAPFGGYKMSGNGREWGDYAFAEFLETKAVLGYKPKEAAE